MTATVDALLAESRAALRAGDPVRARRALEAAAAARHPGRDAPGASPGGHPAEGGMVDGPTVEAGISEGFARAAYLELDYATAIEGWERAYAAYRATDDTVGAIRVARTLGGMYFSIVGDRAVGSGWLARAQTLLAGADSSPERGWISLDVGMFEPDRDRKNQLFREALELGRRRRDTDLEVVALAYLGASLVHADRTAEGMALLDEALAAVAGSEVDDFCVLEEVFCQLFSACEYAHDVRRADEWIRVGEALADRRRLPAVSAFCRTHYGGVLTAAGRWAEAEAALTEAIRLWALGRRSSLRRGAVVRLAELRVHQGRYEEAERLLVGVDVDAEVDIDVDAARPLAAIHLFKGEPLLAADVLERAVAQVDPLGTAAASLLAPLVDAHLAAGRLDLADAASQRLADCAARQRSDYVLAAAALARARVCLASGAGDPHACLREALAGFSRAQMPMEVARSRLERASALVADQPEVALAEARAALEAFDRLQAARHVDAATALLRSLGARTTTGMQPGGLLTRREGEVLELLGMGMSNPEIAERLYISRKTVETHVGNVLVKLGLRSRGEAAAYAARSKSGG